MRSTNLVTRGTELSSTNIISSKCKYILRFIKIQAYCSSVKYICTVNLSFPLLYQTMPATNTLVPIPPLYHLLLSYAARANKHIVLILNRILTAVIETIVSGLVSNQSGLLHYYATLYPLLHTITPG